MAEPEAVAVAVRAVTHRDQYDPVARVELFHSLADISTRWPRSRQAALDGISDEEYVRSVLRVIYRAG